MDSSQTVGGGAINRLSHLLFDTIKEKDMPHNASNITAVLAHLNATVAPLNRWIVADGIHSLPAVSFTNNVASFSSNSGVVVKIFANMGSGEVRFYVAKYLTDVPERANL